MKPHCERLKDERRRSTTLPTKNLHAYDMYHVYTKADGSCPWCHRAIELLTRKELEFVEHPVDRPPFDRSTFPQISRADGTIVGGFEKLRDVVDEPILEENPLRFTLFPLKYPDIFALYQKALASFWTPQEISLADDVSDWTTLSEDDRYFIKHVLAFFAGSDGIVMENLAANFAQEVQIPEARQFYASQMLIEAVHSETYSLLIDALASPDEALSLFRAIETNPAVHKKAAWAQKYLDPSKRFAERLAAFVCVEGLLFSGSFCAVYWLKRRGVMPGLCLSNEFISRDEALHYQFGVQLYKHLRHPLSEPVARALVEEAVNTELEFVVDAIPCRLIGMNADLMCEYIRFVADRLMTDLGYDKIYRATNPFPWMELIALQTKSNFFERFPSDYQRAGVMANSEQQVFALDDAF